MHIFRGGIKFVARPACKWHAGRPQFLNMPGKSKFNFLNNLSKDANKLVKSNKSTIAKLKSKLERHKKLNRRQAVMIKKLNKVVRRQEKSLSKAQGDYGKLQDDCDEQWAKICQLESLITDLENELDDLKAALSDCSCGIVEIPKSPKPRRPRSRSISRSPKARRRPIRKHSMSLLSVPGGSKYWLGRQSPSLPGSRLNLTVDPGPMTLMLPTVKSSPNFYNSNNNNPCTNVLPLLYKANSTLSLSTNSTAPKSIPQIIVSATSSESMSSENTIQVISSEIQVQPTVKKDNKKKSWWQHNLDLFKGCCKK